MEKKTRNALVLIGLALTALFVLVQARPPDGGNGQQPPIEQLVFQTDFSDMVVEGHYLKNLSGNTIAYFNYEDGTAQNDIITPSTVPSLEGGKVLRMQVWYGQEIHKRDELKMNLANFGVGSHFKVVVKVWIPSLYKMTAPPDWHQFQTIIDEYGFGGDFKVSTTLEYKGNAPSEGTAPWSYQIDLSGHGELTWTTGDIPFDWESITGRWVTWVTEVIREPDNNGYVRFEIPEAGLLLEMDSVTTQLYSDFRCVPVKLYGGTLSDKWFLVGNLEIYNMIGQ